MKFIVHTLVFCVRLGLLSIALALAVGELVRGRDGDPRVQPKGTQDVDLSEANLNPNS